MNETKEDLIKVITSKVEILNDQFSFIDFNKLVDICLYISKSPQEQKCEPHLKSVIEFLDFLIDHQDLSRLQALTARKKILSALESHLCLEHEFTSKTDWWTGAVFSLTLDIIALILGISKYYYHIPIFVIFSTCRNVLKLKNAKQEGKYIDW